MKEETPGMAEDTQAAQRPLILVDGMSGMTGDAGGLTLADLAAIVRSNILLLTALPALAFAAALTVAVVATPWFRVETLIAPAKAESGGALSSQLRGLGGLASIAGIDIGGANQSEAVTRAILDSKDLAREFILDEDLVNVLLPDASTDSDASEEARLQSAIGVFKRDVMSVMDDVDSGLIILRMEWTDPELAKAWALDLVARANDRVRRRELDRAERNIAFLEEELQTADVAAVRQSVANLLEREFNSLMLARGNDSFAFEIVDPPVAPMNPYFPNAKLLGALALVLGFIVALVAAVIRFALADDGTPAVAASERR